MSFDLMSQLFGSKKGHAINTAVSNAAAATLNAEAQAVLAKLALPTTVQGAVQYIEVKVDAAISAETVLSDAEKAILTNTINSLATNAAGGS